MVKKKSPPQNIAFVIVFIIFVVYAIGLLIPFVFSFNASLMQNGRAFTKNMTAIAIPPYFSNYLKAFKELNVNDSNFFLMAVNSIWYAAGATFTGIFSSMLLAYATSKYKFRLGKFLYLLALLVMMLPIYGSLPAKYRLMSQLGLLNSPLYLLSTFSAFGFNFIIIHAFFKSISWSFAESAFIDGAGHFKVLFKIMIPMALPSLTAISIMSFVGLWNDYETFLLFLPKTINLSAGLYLYENKIKYAANEPVYFAGVLISIIPVISIFVFFQNTIMQNVYAGGLKG